MSLEDFAPDIADSDLKQISKIAGEILDLREAIEQMESHLRQLQSEERELSQETLPEKMKELGLASFQLDTGEKITIRHKVKASLSKARREEGFAWLAANGHESLIKERVVEQNVHPQTLSAFAREQLAIGRPLPDCFSIYEFDVTEIK